MTEFQKLAKKAVPNIVLTQANDEKEENRNPSRLALLVDNLKEFNKAQQKASYNELVTLFKDSTSQNPTRVFDDNPAPSARPIASRRSSIELKEPTTKPTIENALAVPQGEIKTNRPVQDPLQVQREEEAIKTAKKTIEDLVEAIQCDTSQNYTQSFKYESQKLDNNDWRELTQYRKPST